MRAGGILPPPPPSPPQCLQCGDGTYTDGVELATSCNTCPLGHMCPDRGGTPIKCAEGSIGVEEVSHNQEPRAKSQEPRAKSEASHNATNNMLIRSAQMSLKCYECVDGVGACKGGDLCIEGRRGNLCHQVSERRERALHLCPHH